VRAVTFRDHRGPGCLLSIVGGQVPTVEQIGLAREIQSLVNEASGLVLVAGPRDSGKSTLLAAMVDLVNRGRGGYLITLERQIRFEHTSRSALVSQREVAHSGHQGLAAWAALREDPDALVVDDLRAAGAVEAILEAVSSGRFVVAAVTAHGAADGLYRFLSLVPPDARSEVRLTLSGVLRAVVSQVLLRKSGGGRVAARELLLNSPQVADLVASGQLEQVPAAQEAERDAGMIPLADALMAFVQSGVVDAREAYRQAVDRPGLLGALRREGLDTSFVERLA
jgi:twitching motility protein PilT